MSLFQKFHCLISKSDFSYSGLNPGLLQVEEKNPGNIMYFDFLMDRVGSKWHWPSRPKYKQERKDLRQRLADPKTRLFILKKGEKLIGYCLVSRSSEETASHYNNLIEIENFGLFPEYTGNGFGGYFLNRIFQILFEDYDHVYLTTRSTNHKKVVPFYQENGMHVIKTDVLEEDVLLEEDAFYPIAA